MGIPMSNMDYLQADNEMNTFAKMTGGRAYFPRFQGGVSGDLPRHLGDIRNQYIAVLPADQYQAGWHLSQAESRGRGPGWRAI